MQCASLPTTFHLQGMIYSRCLSWGCLLLATTLVEQGLLSKNRRATMKELILRCDTSMLRALRARAGNTDVLGQEFGMIAVDEIQRMVKRALNKREIHW